MEKVDLTFTLLSVKLLMLGMIFILKLRPETQVKWSLILAALVILYPITKVNGIFPEKEIISVISVTVAEILTVRAVTSHLPVSSISQ